MTPLVASLVLHCPALRLQNLVSLNCLDPTFSLSLSGTLLFEALFFFLHTLLLLHFLALSCGTTVKVDELEAHIIPVSIWMTPPSGCDDHSATMLLLIHVSLRHREFVLSVVALHPLVHPPIFDLLFLHTWNKVFSFISK